MKKRGWRITDLARAANIPASTLYPIWDDKKLVWPQGRTLDKIAKSLGVTVASLISEDPMKITPEQALEAASQAIGVASKLGPDLISRIDRILSTADESQAGILKVRLTSAIAGFEAAYGFSGDSIEPEISSAQASSKKIQKR